MENGQGEMLIRMEMGDRVMENGQQEMVMMTVKEVDSKVHNLHFHNKKKRTKQEEDTGKDYLENGEW